VSDAARPAVLVTGAAGYLGDVVVRQLTFEGSRRVVALDLRAVPAERRLPDVTYLQGDVRHVDFAALFVDHGVDTVVHMASIVERPAGMSLETARDVDVGGTIRLLEGCRSAGVEQLVVTSSGAAYGYHADTPGWLHEEHPLRGEGPFEYALRKRLVEDELARWRREHPQLKQLVLRPGTILGASTRNQITNLFERPLVLGLRGVASPFVFVWDEDVARCVVQGVTERQTGIYNLAGDGVMTLRDIANRTGKRYLPLPAKAVRLGLKVLRRLGLSRYGPEQVAFLEHRPVLDNTRLKQDLGFVPQLSSRQVFEIYWGGRDAA
jgi:UDP-glucose 4-epimerase